MRKGKLFIPLTLDNSGKTFYGEGTWIFIVVLLFLMGFTAVGLASTWWSHMYVDFRGSIIFLVGSELLNIFFWTALIRIFPLKERVLRKIYAETKEHRTTDIGVFWGIYSIEDGKIFFVDGRCGVLVKATRGYLYGRPAGFEEEHFDRLAKFLRHLLTGGYTVKYYNRMVSDANIEPLNETERFISKNRTAGIYYIESSVIKFFRELSQGIADTEREYWLVGCNSVEDLPAMMTRVKQAIDMLYGSIYTEVEIEDQQGIYEFIQNYFGLTYINVQNLIKTTFRKTSKQLVEVVDILYSDQDNSELREAVEHDSNYIPHVDKEDMDNSREMFEKMQKANREARAREYEEKVNKVLQGRGITTAKLSKKKRKKLEKTITEEELANAEHLINDERIASMFDDDEIL